GIYRGKYVIKHNAEAACDPAINPAYWPGFNDVEEPEQDKTNQHPQPTRGGEKHSEPVTHHFVPHNAAVIVNAERAGAAVAPVDAQREGNQQPQNVQRPG